MRETMIDFRPITIEDKNIYEKYLFAECEHGCERSFANLYLWGNQRIAFLHDHIVIFSQFGKYNIYSYPLGNGDITPVIDSLMEDAKERGIHFNLSGLYGNAKQTLESLYPGMFHFNCDRNSFDYVYDINDLAELKGRKYHRKRNHYNRFRSNFPNYFIEPFNDSNISQVKEMVDTWYHARLQENPENDYNLERVALNKALCHYKELGMEGLVLINDGRILAITLGSQISHDTFDVHFEKALWDVDGAYTAINCEFAQYIRNKYSHIKFLNREEDMGLEGLRKSKESYYPHHMVEKCRAVLIDEKAETI